MTIWNIYKPDALLLIIFLSFDINQLCGLWQTSVYDYYTNILLVGAARYTTPLLSKGTLNVQEGTVHTSPLQNSLCRIKGSQAAAQALQLVCGCTFSSTEFNAATCRRMTFASCLNSSEESRRLNRGAQSSNESLVTKSASAFNCFRITPNIPLIFSGSSKNGTLNLRKVTLCSCLLEQSLQKTLFSWAGHW